MTVPIQPGLESVVDAASNNGAQSPVPSSAAFMHGASGERTFTEADIAAARKQEKDKLYSEIESLKTQWASAQSTLKNIQEQKAQELADAERERVEKESTKKAKKEEEMSAKALLEAKLRETNETWESRFAQLQTERETEKALLAKERALSELTNYRNSRLNEESADIAPQFHPFITGETQEQIDSAIAQAKSATQSIAEEVAQARQQQVSQMRGVSATGFTASGPLEGTMGTKKYTAEDINSMSMAEYAKFRQDTGLAGGEAQRSRGILG